VMVLNEAHQVFDPSHRYFHYPAKRVVSKLQAVVDMVIADANKAVVVENPGTVDNLVEGLLLDSAGPRRGQEGADKLQAACALVLENLSLSEVSKGALRAHSGVMSGLRLLASTEAALTDQARRSALAVLFELDEAERQKARHAAAADDGAAPEHVMLSYNWDHQNVIKRINVALQSRQYNVWIDIEKMQGSTVEAMSAAVEDCAVMCYAISEAYKESTNCRMEAQYAFQQQKDMIPLIVEEGYSAKGWLGMMLGVRLWYAFFGSTLTSESAFEGKMEELCRELGSRGKVA
jgi:hypothetical protein